MLLFQRARKIRNRLSISLLCAAFFLLAAGRGSATVLFAGGEDVDFVKSAACDSCRVITTSGTFRPAFARAAITIIGLNNLAYWTGTFNASASDIWVHFQALPSSSTTHLNAEMIKLLDSTDSLPALLIRGSGTASVVNISTKDAGGSYVDLLSCNPTWPGETLDQFDMHVVYAVAGSVNLYRNGVNFCSFTGNVTTSGRTALSGIELGAAVGAQGFSWSEVIVADEDTRAFNLWTIPPLSSGTLTQFNPSNGCSSVWDVTTYSDSSNVSASSPNLIQECTVTATLPAGAFEALAYKIAARAAVGITGPQHFDAVTHISGTDYFSTDILATATQTNYATYQAVNPATSAPWVPTDFTDPGFQFGIKSKP